MGSGEGFKGEKVLTIVGVTVGIVSSLLLINVLTMQRKYYKQILDDFNNYKQEQSKQTKND